MLKTCIEKMILSNFFQRIHNRISKFKKILEILIYKRETQE